MKHLPIRNINSRWRLKRGEDHTLTNEDQSLNLEKAGLMVKKTAHPQQIVLCAGFYPPEGTAIQPKLLSEYSSGTILKKSEAREGLDLIASLKRGQRILVHLQGGNQIREYYWNGRAFQNTCYNAGEWELRRRRLRKNRKQIQKAA